MDGGWNRFRHSTSQRELRLHTFPRIPPTIEHYGSKNKSCNSEENAFQDLNQ